MYDCPNCHKITHTPGAEPPKCEICNRTIGFECMDCGICNHCRRAIINEEYQEKKSFFSGNAFVTILLISLVIFDIVSGLYVVSGLLFDNQQ